MATSVVIFQSVFSRPIAHTLEQIFLLYYSESVFQKLSGMVLNFEMCFQLVSISRCCSQTHGSVACVHAVSHFAVHSVSSLIGGNQKDVTRILVVVYPRCDAAGLLLGFHSLFHAIVLPLFYSCFISFLLSFCPFLA